MCTVLSLKRSAPPSVLYFYLCFWGFGGTGWGCDVHVQGVEVKKKHSIKQTTNNAIGLSRCIQAEDQKHTSVFSTCC